MMNKCFFGHNIDTMRQLAADGVTAQTCVTSPPYWGLRDYGIPPVPWPAMEYAPMPGLPPVVIPAWEGCLGLEPDPLMFVGHMVQVFRAVWDVLADDGTCWVNMGDGYAGSWGSQGRQGNTGQMAGRSVADARQRSNIQAARIESGCYPAKQQNTGSIPDESGLKPKDLMMIPARVAMALQADGWYLRQDIIWAKPNPMPESVTDRCTKSHEYFFLLTKGERYYYDAEAIKEKASENTHARRAGNGTGVGWGYSAESDPKESRDSGRRVRKLANAGSGVKNNDSMDDALSVMPERRNKRSVWTVGTKPYPGAHFATFPPALIEPCILAGSRPGDIVLDPFFGSGTTGEVAEHLGRQWIGCELGEQYEPLQRARTRQMGMAV